MPGTVGLSQSFYRLPRQKTCFKSEFQSEPPKLRRCGTTLEDVTRAKASQDVNIVRQKTLTYEVWNIVADNGTICRASAPENSPHYLNIVAENGTVCRAKVPENSPESLSRPESRSIQSPEKIRKIPVLGPTRQETEIYFNRKRRTQSGSQLQGLSLRGPSSVPDNKTLSIGENEESVSRDVSIQDSKARTKDTITNLTSSTLPSKRCSTHSIEYQDVRFFAELVKPLQCRLKRKQDKIIVPSKHGYHPRSHSPTFKRLIAATEKLQIISESESRKARERQTSALENLTGTPSWQTPRRTYTTMNNQTISASEPYSIVSESDANTPRNIYINISNPNVDSGLHIPGEYPPRQDTDNGEGYTSEETVDVDNDHSEAYFKVDFKVEQSHASLRLFLPHINGSGERRVNDVNVGNDDDKLSDDQMKLPPLMQTNQDNISRTSSIKKIFKKNAHSTKKKKKRIERCPSAYDEDKRIRDHLNDVSTLISLETDGCKSFKQDSLCPFENCSYHTKHAEETR